MKKLIVLVFILAFGSLIQAQEFKGLDKSPLDMIEYPGNRGESQWARILYSRPQLKGRDYKSLVPSDKIWRLGANESTELTLYIPMKVGNTSLAAGVYTLYALPAENEITIIINKENHVWGAYSYKKDLDVVRVTVPLTKTDKSIEAFSMVFGKGSSSNVDLHMGWEYYRAKISFTK